LILDKNWHTNADRLSKYKIADIFNLIVKDGSAKMKNKELKNIVNDELPYLKQYILPSEEKYRSLITNGLSAAIIGNEKDIHIAALKDELKFWTQRVETDDKFFWEIRDRLKKRIENLER
jgi:hypothetical protein